MGKIIISEEKISRIPRGEELAVTHRLMIRFHRLTNSDWWGKYGLNFL